MLNRRDFIKQTSLLGAGFLTYPDLFAYPNLSSLFQNKKFIWANLLHLSFNMWGDITELQEKNPDYNNPDLDCMQATEYAKSYRPFLTFDQSTWDTLLKKMSDSGMNMVVLDLGDGVKYKSHPEIAVKNAWSTEKLRAELTKIKKMGLEPIPKMNFATTHSAWLGEYARQISSKKYYMVCRDLINEVIDLFDKPRFFHLGMDEETAYQPYKEYVVVRKYDLWWKDLYYLVDLVEMKGSRAWIWSDYGWQSPENNEIFFKKMPKNILQSNWYYFKEFNENVKEVKFYEQLEKHGYDQLPCGGNWNNDENIRLTVEYCKKIISPSRLYGFLATSWAPTLKPCLRKNLATIEQMEVAQKEFYPSK